MEYINYIVDYIDPALIPIVLVLLFVGAQLKKSSIRDELIPWLLIPIGIGVVGLWLLAQAIPGGMGQWLVLIVNAVIQGTLCAAVAVLASQLVIQSKKLNAEPTVTVDRAKFEEYAMSVGFTPKELLDIVAAEQATTSQ